MNPLKTMITKGLSLIRRGENGVIWTGDGKRGGNYLYVWLRADTNLRNGRSTPLLYKDNMKEWLEEFPALSVLTIHREDVKFTTPRFGEWPISYGTDFTEDDLKAFLEQRLLSSPKFAEKLSSALSASDPNQLTINIRRGDYYGTPFEKTYGIDVKSYVIDALECFDGIKSIRIVSDDIEWCRANLDMFPRSLPTYFGSAVSGAFGDLATIASSENLILPNSTFSYWGGFLSDHMSSRTNRVVVPEIHERYGDDNRKWPLPERWQRITTTQST